MDGFRGSLTGSNSLQMNDFPCREPAEPRVGEVLVSIHHFIRGI